ncbi:MAG: GrpB family protein [Candidatus Dormibacteria bacterium]
MTGGAGEGELGLTRGVVSIAESNPGWSTVYDRLAAALSPALGGLVAAIEHIGSTSVPQLAAKPIIDIAIRLVPEVEGADLTPVLTPLGYEFRGDKGDQGGLLFVLEDRPEHRIVHLHAIRDGDPQWLRFLTVRDRLRADAAAREAYGALKRSLAIQFAGDRAAYTAAKTSFVARLLASVPLIAP